MVSSQINHPSNFFNTELLNSIDFLCLFKYWDKHPASLHEAVLLSCCAGCESAHSGWQRVTNVCFGEKGWQTLDHRLKWCMSNTMVKWTAVPAVSVSMSLVPDFRKCQDSQRTIKLDQDKHDIQQRWYFCRTEPMETLRMKQTLAVPSLICPGVSPDRLHCSDQTDTTE